MHPLQLEELYETVYRRFADFARAYDGDTLYFDVDEGDYRWERGRPLRVFGIDTPELNPAWSFYTDPNGTRLGEDREREKAAAREARDRAIAYCAAATDKIVVQTIKRRGKKVRDKYGRTLARVLIPINSLVLDLGERLLADKHAVSYQGGKKLPWTFPRPIGQEDPTPEEVAAILLKSLSR